VFTETKVLLINPISDIAVKGTNYRSTIAFVPPVGIAYLASSLVKENGIKVIIEDQFASGKPNEYLLDKIRKENPQIVGFSCLSPGLPNITRLSRLIKEISPGIKIVLGNIHATVFAKEMLEAGIGDVVVRGEGENSFRETVLAFRQNKKLDNIKGISFRRGQEVISNADRELLEDLEQLPYPAWDLLDLDLYKRYPMLGMYDEVILPIQASRGCSNKCIFCSQNMMYKKPRYRDNDKVLDEIEYMVERFKIRYFGFNDAYFPFSVQHGLEFCERLMERGLHKKIQWITETRVDKVSEKLLKKMKEAGLRLIMYGFEVGNQSVLDSINKRTTLKQAEEAMYYTRKAKVKSLGLFMLGLPEDTEETCRQTIEFAIRLKPDMAKFNLTIPQPGSKLHEICKNDLKDVKAEELTSWSDWISSRARVIYTPPKMTSERLLSLQRKAMFKFYANPKRILLLLWKGSFSMQDIYLGAKLIVTSYLKDVIRRFMRSAKRPADAK